MLGGLLRRAVGIGGVGGWGIALAVSAVVAALDETYQAMVPGRFPSVLDWVADVIGASIGSGALPFLKRWLGGIGSRVKGP